MANEAFSSVVNDFAASFTSPVRPLEVIDTGPGIEPDTGSQVPAVELTV